MLFSSGSKHRKFLSTPSARRATRVVAVVADPDLFLSTPSARRATLGTTINHLLGKISIHALREEGDSVVIRPCGRFLDFYPRPPRGGRHGRNSHT